MSHHRLRGPKDPPKIFKIYSIYGSRKNRSSPSPVQIATASLHSLDWEINSDNLNGVFHHALSKRHNLFPEKVEFYLEFLHDSKYLIPGNTKSRNSCLPLL